MAAAYAKGVREADAALGALVAGVREQLEAPPLVVVVADHGESLDERLADQGYAYDHGEFLDREQVRVPMLLAGPGVTSGRSPGAVSIRDLYATLLAAAGVADDAPERDLRVPSDARRIVTVERHELAGGPGDERSAAAVRAQAAAASDGSVLVRVGEDGTPASEASGAPSELVDAARAAASAAARRAGRPGPVVDAATKEALRALGYAE
jgi:choline-sulfatase